MSKQKQPTNIKFVSALVVGRFFFLSNFNVFSYSYSFSYSLYVFPHFWVSEEYLLRSEKKSFAERSELQRHGFEDFLKLIFLKLIIYLSSTYTHYQYKQNQAKIEDEKFKVQKFSKDLKKVRDRFEISNEIDNLFLLCFITCK